MNQQSGDFYTFGSFRLDARERLLICDGRPVPLASKTFEALLLLVQNAGHLVTKDILMKQLWPDSFVEEANLTKHISLLRKVLGGTVDGLEYIETIPKHGYRFVAAVANGAEETVAPAPVPSPSPLPGQTSVGEREHPVPRGFNGGWRLLAAGALVAAVLAGIMVRVAKRPPTSPLELKLRQLTTNSFENRVTSGGISPDGKYLAYSDTKGMYVKLSETGETRAIPLPEELKDQNVGWQWAAWFPDSTGFVANAHRSGTDGKQWDSRESSIWMVSVLGEAPRKLRDNAIAWSVSPDGSLISFGTNKGRFGEREIWLMGPGDDQARKLIDTDEESSIGELNWSPDGKRILYVKADQSGDTLLSRNPTSGPPTTLFGPGEMKKVRDLIWLADGRLLYSREEPESFFGSACNFWEMRLDASTGEPVEKPRRLTNWSGFCMSGISTTADGKRLAFLKWVGHMTSYVAELNGDGTRILKPHHFPLTESSDGAVDWTADSSAIFFVSNRAGKYGIYKQSLDREIAVPIVTEGYGRNPRVTPDGENILYLGPTENGAPPGRTPEHVMRVSVGGGASKGLFTAKFDSQISCPRSPSQLCTMSETSEDHKQLTVTALDPAKGRGPLLLRLPIDPNDTWWSEVSPDGARIAVTLSSSSPIYIYSVRGELLQQIHAKGLGNVLGFAWTSNGRSLFVTVGIRGGRDLLYVGLKGNSHLLWEELGGSGETLAVASPDGRYLAFSGWTTSGNMWLLQNF